jgi:hypothetical protein
MKLTPFALWCLFLASIWVEASELGAATAAEKPDSTGTNASAGSSLTLSVATWPQVGTARLKVLFWQVYDSALYTPSGQWEEGPPYQLSLSYLRDIPVHQLVEETEKAWRQQGVSHDQQALWLQTLGTLWPDVSAGDTLVLGVDTAGNNGFWFNGEFIGAIDHPDFGRLFGGIWLSEDSPRPALRAQLIGLDDA